MHAFKLLATTLPMLAFGCGGHTHKDQDPSAIGTPDSKAVTAVPPTSDTHGDGKAPPSRPMAAPEAAPYRFETIIREFGSFNGQPDRAALFIVANTNGTVKIKTVTGAELGQGYHATWGTIEQVAEAPAGLFKQSALPMSDSDRQKLLAQYKGATAVYFEHYQNALCDGTAKKYDMTVDLLGAPAQLTFSFKAYAQEGSECVFTVLEEMARV